MRVSNFKLPKVKPYLLGLLCLKAFGINEVFDLYNSPECLAKGNACTAAISGYASNYYNPAALSLTPKKKSEINLVVLEGNLGFGALENISKNFSTGLYQLIPKFEANIGNYHFSSFITMPSITFRNFSFSILYNNQIAAVTINKDQPQLDVDARQDLVPTIGYSQQFAGNLLKLGITAKAVFRNQIKGLYDHLEIDAEDEATFNARGKEGMGIGADIGMLLTLPHRYLPTIGVSIQDLVATSFSQMTLFNSAATQAPEDIPQSIHLGFSLNPTLSREWKTTFSFDYRHLENSTIDLTKHLHFGLELNNQKSLMFWLGLNQMYLTAGAGLRVKGGNLEVGTYAKEIGTSNASLEDRRGFFRYTISF